jgi:hypothetical protein
LPVSWCRPHPGGKREAFVERRKASGNQQQQRQQESTAGRRVRTRRGCVACCIGPTIGHPYIASVCLTPRFTHLSGLLPAHARGRRLSGHSAPRHRSVASPSYWRSWCRARVAAAGFFAPRSGVAGGRGQSGSNDDRLVASFLRELQHSRRGSARRRTKRLRARWSPKPSSWSPTHDATRFGPGNIAAITRVEHHANTA